MVNRYSVDTHQYITEKIADAQSRLKGAARQNDMEAQQYYKGQLKELYFFRRYLSEKIDLKTQTYF